MTYRVARSSGAHGRQAEADYVETARRPCGTGTEARLDNAMKELGRHDELADGCRRIALVGTRDGRMPSRPGQQAIKPLISLFNELASYRARR